MGVGTVIAWAVADFVAPALINYAISSIASSFVASAFSSAPERESFGGGAGFASEAKGRTQIVRSTTQNRRVLYGEAKLSGVLVYGSQTGASNEYVHLVVELVGHECNAIGDVYLNDDIITAAMLDAGGNVISGKYSGLVRIKKHLGEVGQVADADLMADDSGYASTRTGDGICYLYARFKWDQTAFPTGLPNIAAVVQGKKLYDVRDGITRYSTNWALCVYDYLIDTRYGLSCDASEVDSAVFIAAANACDERASGPVYTNTFTVDPATDELTCASNENVLDSGDGVRFTTTGTLPAGLALATTVYLRRTGKKTFKVASSYANAQAGTFIDLTTAGTGVHTISFYDQVRYTCNGTINTGSKPLEVIKQLVSAGGGKIVYTQGVWKAYAGVYAAPVGALTVADLAGEIDVLPRVERNNLFNAVQGTFVSPFDAWQPIDFPMVTSATYEAQDGGRRLPKDVDFPFTNNVMMAQRLAKLMLEKARQSATVTWPGKYTVFKYAVPETVTVTVPQLGYAAKEFTIENWKYDSSGGAPVTLQLQAEASACYTWASADAQVPNLPPDTNLQKAFVVATPGTPSVTETLYETTGSAGVKTRATVSWSASADAFVSSYEAQFKAQAAADWLSLAPISLTSAQAEDLAPGFYNFRVRAINQIGVRSAWSATTTKELLGLTAPPADVSGFSIIKSAGVGIAQFSLHGDLDVRIGGRIVVRWSPLTTGATWNDSIIFEEFNGDAVSGMIPLRTGTYMAKARDSTGVYSTSAVSFVATEGLVTGFTTVGTLTEHTAFSGAKTNTAVVSSGLQLDGTTLIDSMVTSIDAWPFIDSLGGVSGTGSYAFTTYLDLSTVATRRFESTVAATQFDTGDLIDSRTDLIDDWIDIDGATIEDCDATLYVRTTDDNPAGSPTWGAWTPFFVGDFTCRAAQFKLDLVSGSATHNIRITSLAVSAKIPT